MATQTRPTQTVEPRPAEEVADRARVLGQVVTGDEPTPLRDPLSTFLAEVVAKRYGLDPTESHFQLADHVATDALDGLFGHAQSNPQVSWRLEIDIGAETLAVDSDGFVAVSSAGRPGADPLAE